MSHADLHPDTAASGWRLLWLDWCLAHGDEATVARERFEMFQSEVASGESRVRRERATVRRPNSVKECSPVRSHLAGESGRITAMARPPCGGVVETLRGQHVAFTGKTLINGEWVTRDWLPSRVLASGALSAEPSRRWRGVTLLVIGELGDNVVDWRGRRSETLVYYETERTAGNHICMVNDAGISALLDGQAAPCLESRSAGPGAVEFRLPSNGARTEPGETGAQRQTRMTDVVLSSDPIHAAPASLSADLSGLDESTARHNETLRRLVRHLAPWPVSGLTRPKVDAVWEQGDGVLFVGEVKSLTDTNHAQQIRLGIGQVLDYAHQVCTAPPDGNYGTIQPVLILEREPDDDRWIGVCESVGITLTWAPDFPRI